MSETVRTSVTLSNFSTKLQIKQKMMIFEALLLKMGDIENEIAIQLKKFGL